MIEKMWDKIEKQFFPKKYTDCGRLIGGTKQVDKMELKKLIFKEFKIKDPFENVRAMLLINHISGGKLQEKVAKALQEDIENFDKGAG